MTLLEGSWYSRTESGLPMAHSIWVTATGSALTHCLATARLRELRPRIPTDLVCPGCWCAVDNVWAVGQ